MTREEQKKKIYYVQMSKDFFESKNIQQLLATSAGDTIFRIYLQLWCKSLATGGTLPLEGDVPMAEELAIILGLLPLKKLALDRWQAELKIIESAVEICEKYRLIEVTECGIEFLMTGEYTRAWTKEAIEKRANRQAETNEAAEATAPIETTQDQPEETEEAKPEKKKKKPAPVRHRYGEYNNVLLSDEEMEKLKSEFPNDYQKRIENLSGYMESKGKSYKNHLATIRNWARMNGETPQKGQQTTQTQAPTRESVKKRLEADGVISYAGVDHNRWNKVQDKYTDEEKVWAVKIMAENEI